MYGYGKITESACSDNNFVDSKYETLLRKFQTMRDKCSVRQNSFLSLQWKVALKNDVQIAVGTPSTVAMMNFLKCFSAVLWNINSSSITNATKVIRVSPATPIVEKKLK